MSLISDSYRKLNAQYHREHPEYGSYGQRWAFQVKSLAHQMHGKTILDFGCGKDTLAQALQSSNYDVTSYDPAIPGKDQLPDKVYDIVACTDVMEHVETEYVDRTISMIMTRMRLAGLFVISLQKTGRKAMLADGTPKHRTLLDAKVWYRKFKRYGNIEHLIPIRTQEIAFIVRIQRKRFHIITEMAWRHGWTYGAEVGVFQGRTLFHLMDNTKLKMVAVDLWADVPRSRRKGIKDMETGVTDYHKYPLADYEAEVRERAAKYRDRIRFIKEPSHLAARHIEDKSLDFVFIDASHETADVERDIRAWTPKLKPQGYLMGHDATWPSVRTAIDKLVPGWTGEKDSVWYRQRSAINL